MTQWVEFHNAQEVAQAASDMIREQARVAIKQRGEFKLVLAGGTTPLSCYRLLAQQDLDWDKWKLFYGDERCLAPDHAQRNHQMVMETGLVNLISQHYIIPAELGPEKGAMTYASMISGQTPFDLVLLGMGEDGHTASLFPGHDLLNESEALVIGVEGAPKFPPGRISLSLSALQDCRKMLVLVTGESKRGPVQQWRLGEGLPVARVADCEQALVFVEATLMM